ncbi:MAG: YceI family protein [Flavobacteriales bacterium]|nr:YceI family protein [Flavobacteriales bacterium]
MKSRNSIFTSLATAVLIGVFALSASAQETDYTVIPDKSELKWKAYKVGGFHEGVVDVKQGEFTTSGNQIMKGTFVVDMPTMKITDVESPKLLKHLHSPDFFDIANFPESTLILERTEKLEGEEYRAFGNIVIRGVTQPISFKIAPVAQTENFISYKAKIEIDRTKFGIVYRSSAVGDSFIMDNFEIEAKITAKKF